MSDSVFRLRPMNNKTIDELNTPYLWFSRSSSFNDPNDANIKAFIENSSIVKDALKRHLTEQSYNKFIELMNCTGICCFTKALPSVKSRLDFPKGFNSICIEYDKEILEDFFLKSKFAINNCFTDVLYCKNPLKLNDEGDYHILSSIEYLDSSDPEETDTVKQNCLYESLLSLTRNEKDLEHLIILLLSRICCKFHRQHELRIILGGRNIPDFNPNIRGYQVVIPPEAILKVHLYGQSKKCRIFREKLKESPIYEKIHIMKNK